MQAMEVSPRARAGVVLATLVLATGCGKHVSASVPEAASRAGAAPPAEARAEFAFTGVSVRYSAPKLTVAYAVHNRGDKRGRGGTCLEVLDAQGFLIERLNPGDFSLRAGDSDELEETVEVESHAWAQARWLRLYAGKRFGCYSASTEALGPVLHLDLAGQPLAPGTPVPGPKPEDPGWLAPGSAPLFSVEDVQWSQQRETGFVTVSYTVRNLAPHRASASVCVRLYARDTCNCQSLADASTGSFTLAPGASERHSSSLLLEDDAVWNHTRLLKLYASKYGCVDGVEEARSAVLTQDKPADILGPPEFIPDEAPAAPAAATGPAGGTP